MKTYRTYSPKPYPFRLSNIFYPVVVERVEMHEVGKYISSGSAVYWETVYVFGFCIFAKKVMP